MGSNEKALDLLDKTLAHSRKHGVSSIKFSAEGISVEAELVPVVELPKRDLGKEKAEAEDLASWSS